ncbi:hypothetical protein RYX36_022595 [Vicia faba]
MFIGSNSIGHCNYGFTYADTYVGIIFANQKTSNAEGDVEGSFRGRWLIFISVVLQKFLMFIAKPLAKLGTCVKMLVNLIALNGGIIMIIINFLSAIAAAVTIPPDAQRNVTFY